MKDDIETIHVLAGQSDSRAVMEELPTKRLPGNKFLLLASPGLALNIAKGDIIQLDENNSPINIERGGNFCIQIYGDSIDAQLIDDLENTVKNSLQGSLDGKHGGALSFSIPARNGFDTINPIFDKFSLESGVDWYYANIYKYPDDQEDETLLDWWLDS